MTSIAIDRNDGLSSATAIKGPVRCVTTTAITLSGLQTIDGVVLSVNDRVLVAVTGGSVDNGIWVVDTGSWRRAKDFAGNRDVRKGTLIYVTDGTAYAGSGWVVNTNNPITIGTTVIVIGQSYMLNTLDVVPATLFGATLSGTAPDLALIKLAWQYAVAHNIPFLIPDRGLPATLSGQPGGIIINVPTDFATLQAAQDAIQNWIFPAAPPLLASYTPASNHVKQMAVTILMNGVQGLDGRGIVWNHPHGEQIEIRSSAPVGMTLNGAIGITGPSSGYYDITLPFAESTANIIVGHFIRLQLPVPSSHTGKWYILDGGWPVVANNTGTNTVTICIKTVGLAALAATLTAGAGIFVHQNGGIRVINMPANGADTGCIEVHTTLNIRDLIVRGDSTNSSDTDGIMVREGAHLYANRCSINGHQRAAIRSLNGDVFADACGLNDNTWGLNIQAGKVNGTYTSVTGNTTGIVLQENATGRMAQLRACACSTGLRAVGRAHLLCGTSLYFTDNAIGADVDVGAYMNLGDATMIDNTTAPWRVKPGGSLVHTSYANVVGTGTPPASSGLTKGGGYVGLDVQTADSALFAVSTSVVPNLLIGGVNTGITYNSTPVMHYQVANNRITGEMYFRFTSKGGLTGAVTIDNMPVASVATLPAGIGIVHYVALNSAIASVVGKMGTGTTIMALQKSGASSYAALDGGDLTNTTELTIYFDYRVT